jgi:hypothetical protein
MIPRETSSGFSRSRLQKKADWKSECVVLLEQIPSFGSLRRERIDQGQSRYWIDQTSSEVGSGLVDPTGPDRLADLVDPDQYQIDLVGTSHWYRGQVLVGKVQHS